MCVVFIWHDQFTICFNTVNKTLTVVWHKWIIILAEGTSFGQVYIHFTLSFDNIEHSRIYLCIFSSFPYATLCKYHTPRSMDYSATCGLSRCVHLNPSNHRYIYQIFIDFAQKKNNPIWTHFLDFFFKYYGNIVHISIVIIEDNKNEQTTYKWGRSLCFEVTYQWRHQIKRSNKSTENLSKSKFQYDLKISKFSLTNRKNKHSKCWEKGRIVHGIMKFWWKCISIAVMFIHNW